MSPSARGCLVAAAVGALVLGAAGVGGYAWWTDRKERALAEQSARAEEEFRPALDALADAAAPGSPYDVDRTVRVIHELDRALREKGSMQEYLRWSATQDYRGVAPEVLAARGKLLEVLQRLYARQTEAEQQAAAWQLGSQSILEALSVLQVGGSFDTTGIGGADAHLGLDQAQAKRLVEERLLARKEQQRLVREYHEVEAELVEAMLAYSQTWYAHLERWDALCSQRDQAYLAARDHDWKRAMEHADEAARLSPTEREAHLLAAWARIEAPALDPEFDVVAALTAYADNHPDRDAPAQLLLGVYFARNGDHGRAKGALDTAAAHYPRQAAQLADMADPYKARAWLRQSREGTAIVRQYEATMLGAGSFSPDLQLAQLYFERGQEELGQRKVLDHFARRRNQKEWSFVLDDLEFARGYLGDRFHAIFPEDAYLDLVVKPAMLGTSVGLSVDNRSDTTLHNATLLLTLQLTDMIPGDYVVVQAGPTQPQIAPRDRTAFGDLEIAVDRLGTTKTAADVVRFRAIVVSDEAVAWVDTADEKLAAATRLDAAPPPLPEAASKVLAAAMRTATATVTPSMIGADSITFSLPRELVLLGPTFRLRAPGGTLAPAEHVFRDGAISLRFDRVAEFATAPPEALVLVLTAREGVAEVRWTLRGERWAVATP